MGRPVPERTAAKAAGQTTYNTGKPCRNGHLFDRRTSTGNCIMCDREKAKRFAARGGTPPHPNRIIAQAAGERHYSGQPCPKGHDKRWVKNGNCAECGVARSTRWKNARPGYEATYKRSLRKRDPSKHRRYQKAYVKKNRAKVKAALVAWKTANADYFRRYNAVYQSNRRARKAKNGGFYTPEDVAQLHEQQKGCCAACGTNQKKLEVDHIVPVVKGGSNDPSNLQLLCGPCNKSKGAQDAEEWLRSRQVTLSSVINN